jgi:hypothetical protein
MSHETVCARPKDLLSRTGGLAPGRGPAPRSCWRDPSAGALAPRSRKVLRGASLRETIRPPPLRRRRELRPARAVHEGDHRLRKAHLLQLRVFHGAALRNPAGGKGAVPVRAVTEKVNGLNSRFRLYTLRALRRQSALLATLGTMAVTG